VKRGIGEGMKMVCVSPTRDAAGFCDATERKRLGTWWREPLDAAREPFGFDLLQDHQQVDGEMVARSLAGQSGASGEAKTVWASVREKTSSASAKVGL